LDTLSLSDWQSSTHAHSKFESHLGHTIVWQKFLVRVRKAAEDGCMKTISKTRPCNVTPFVLEDCWALDGLDQPTMRWLSKVAKRNHVTVGDVIYEALEFFVVKCEAEADLEKKIIKFPKPLKRLRRDGSLIRVRQRQSTFHPPAQ
jgi:hypothetical protein